MDLIYAFASNYGLSFIIGFAILGAIVTGLSVAFFLRVVVPTNWAHIVQRGKSTQVYGYKKPAGNIYYAWPSWFPFIGISVTKFPESIFTVNLKDYEAYDIARLPFRISAVAWFRVENAETVAQRVERHEKLIEDLREVMSGSVRQILATTPLESIMEQRAELGAAFTQQVQAHVAQWGVEPVKSIEFMDITDVHGSAVIENIMAKEKSRIDMESRVKVAENQRSATLAEIDAEREIGVRRQDAEQQVGTRTAEKDRVVGIANEEAQQEIKAAAAVTAERDMAVKKVTDVRTAEINKEVAIVQAEEAKAVQVTQAEADKDAKIVVADGELQAAHKDAEGIEALGKAKATAETAMLMAPVEAQIKLAKEIGANVGYQEYLLGTNRIEAGKVVGTSMADAMGKADMKVIANGGDIQGGISSLGDLFSTKGGTNLSGMLSALAQTDEGKTFLGNLTTRIGGPLAAAAAAKAATTVDATPAEPAA